MEHLEGLKNIRVTYSVIRLHEHFLGTSFIIFLKSVDQTHNSTRNLIQYQVQ